MDALDLLAQDNYIIVNKTLIREIGLENSIVLGALCGYQRYYGIEEFYKEQEQIIDDTGLSEYTIRKSIKELKSMEYIEVHKRGMPAKMYYKINLQKFNFQKSRSCEIDTSSGCEIEGVNNNNKYINKENNNNKNNNNKEIIKEIYEHWQSKAIIKHNEINDDRKKAITKALKENSVENIKLAMDHYKIMLDDRNCIFKYKWSLEEFLTRKNGYKTFLNDGSNWVNYNSPKIVKQGLVNAEIVRPRRNDNDII